MSLSQFILEQPFEKKLPSGLWGVKGKIMSMYFNWYLCLVWPLHKKLLKSRTEVIMSKMRIYVPVTMKGYMNMQFLTVLCGWCVKTGVKIMPLFLSPPTKWFWCSTVPPPPRLGLLWLLTPPPPRPRRFNMVASGRSCLLQKRNILLVLSLVRIQIQSGDLNATFLTIYFTFIVYLFGKNATPYTIPQFGQFLLYDSFCYYTSTSFNPTIWPCKKFV